MKTQIAQALNVQENQILDVREWAFVYWVKVAGKRPTLVSKKKIMTKQELSHSEAAEQLASMLVAKGYKANVWRKKEGETRIYTKYGYILVTPDIKWENGFAWFTKSYEIEELKPTVEEWSSKIIVSKNETASKSERILMQEDEDGVIAPVGQHEPGVYIVREWYVNA